MASESYHLTYQLVGRRSERYPDVLMLPSYSSEIHAILAVWLCRAGETLIVLAALGSKVGASSWRPSVDYITLLLLQIPESLKTSTHSKSDLRCYLELLNASLILEVLFSLLQYSIHCFSILVPQFSGRHGKLSLVVLLCNIPGLSSRGFSGFVYSHGKIKRRITTSPRAGITFFLLYAHR